MWGRQVAALTEITKSSFSQAGRQAPQRIREGAVETGDHIYILIISQHLELKISSRIILLGREEFRGSWWFILLSI